RPTRVEESDRSSMPLSSLAAIGGEGATPSVNLPEAALLGISRVAIRPVREWDMLSPRRIVPLELSRCRWVLNFADGSVSRPDFGD
ncbi:MAG: 2-oxo acid dehydrogenase subunit E2, partial [Boseongicola sp.]|nr:2-oxo acid dehydrogenase subunit E2 [Boseongicola sp.]